MIDTHSHIYDPAYKDDFEAMIARARQAGVHKLVMPGIDSTCHDDMVACADALPDFAYPAIGLHPTEVKDNWRQELQFVFDHYDQRPWCAIGEIGMDLYWSKDYLEEQKEVFCAQLSLSYEKDLPVIIHAREATEEIFECIKKVAKPLRGVFHAFTGSYETYRRIKASGDFFVGIGGVVTFKNAHVAVALERIPLEDILLETDAPYLTPVPYRGRRNESAYVRFVAEKIASIKGVDFEAVERATTANAEKLFRFLKNNP
ncbi:MAG: TatD family hydrolase [Bacteroidales bacterium]|nr:TatD family hydrolase [Bacteroidales bacterium]